MDDHPSTIVLTVRLRLADLFGALPEEEALPRRRALASASFRLRAAKISPGRPSSRSFGVTSPIALCKRTSFVMRDVLRHDPPRVVQAQRRLDPDALPVQRLVPALDLPVALRVIQSCRHINSS